MHRLIQHFVDAFVSMEYFEFRSKGLLVSPKEVRGIFCPETRKFVCPVDPTPNAHKIGW